MARRMQMRLKPLPPAEACFVRGENLLNGAFIFPRKSSDDLRVIVSDGTDWQACGLKPPAWEHVSVSLAKRCPTYDELMWVKALWWRDDELVVQLHVPKSQHINHHPFCLHLWRPIGIELPLPPSECVAPKGVSNVER